MAGNVLVTRAQLVGAEIITKPPQQPWGYAGTFVDLDGHLWMVTAAPPPD